MPEHTSAALKELLDRMIAAGQLSALDAENLSRSGSIPKSEEEILRWLAKEYDVPFISPEEVEPDKQVLLLFPARILLKEELLPLRRVNGHIEIATSRLFATHGLDALKTMTG